MSKQSALHDMERRLLERGFTIGRNAVGRVRYEHPEIARHAYQPNFVKADESILRKFYEMLCRRLDAARGSNR